MDALKLLKLWKAWSSEKGAELIEFALTFPLLLLITMGIIDFGLLFQRYEVITNASREGARIAVLPGYEEDDIVARVNQYLQGTSLSAATVTTVVGAAQTLPVGSGSCITVTPVTVSYDHQYMFVGGIITYFGSSLGTRTLTATTSMRSETAAGTCP
jgi:Flp pilus assembly protein TadG